LQSNSIIIKVVNRYIGVSEGYLGDFSYRTHADFYIEYCDLDIDPYGFEGTTRQRFINIFESIDNISKSKMLKGVVERFPVEEASAPKTRTENLKVQILDVAAEYAGAAPVASPNTVITSPIVRQAISDAEHLLKANGATSSIDRVHTAMHGFLIAACDSESITHPKEASINKLLKLLRKNHPKLNDLGHREQDIDQILNSSAAILNAFNPLRNQGSVAHPNKHLIGKSEAMLVINIARSLIHYLDSKLS
jgi:hypothetical protein